MKIDEDFRSTLKRILLPKRERNRQKNKPEEKCFILIPARLLEYVRYEDMPMQHEFYTIASPGKQSTFQEHKF